MVLFMVPVGAIGDGDAINAFTPTTEDNYSGKVGNRHGVIKNPEALRLLEAQIVELENEPDFDEKGTFDFIIEVEKTDNAPAPIGIEGRSGAFGGAKDGVAYRDNKALASYVAARKNEQSNVRAQIFREVKSIAKKGATMRSTVDEVSFKVLFNGFVMKSLTLEEARAITQVDGVKGVYYDTKIARPVEKSAAPSMFTSREMVGATAVNNMGYTGKGRVIAILDSGADPEHQDMQMEDYVGIKYTEEGMKAKMDELALAGLPLKGYYYSPKMPYGYNYFDHDDLIKETSKQTGNHGMHVAGTVAACGPAGDAGRVRGVLPDAQLLIMRVFGNNEALTNSSAYTEALEDAVLLGADSANMSLGSPSGSVLAMDTVFFKAVEKAKNAGVVVAIANGNDAHIYSKTSTLPKITNQEWGTAGSPATMRDSLAVANYMNDSVYAESTVNANGKTYLSKPMDTIADAIDTGLESGKEYEFVDVGQAVSDKDFEGKDVNGKIALIQRGGSSFAQKITLAGKHGAIAVVLGNNEVDKPDYFIIMQTQTKGLIPAYSVTYRSYEAIKALEDKKLALEFNPHYIENPSKGKMDASTSWGPTPDLEMKPEISAPGGDIRSTLNDNTYDVYSGTSMATPHVAAGISVAASRLEKLNTRVENEAKYRLIKNLLMTTADPIPAKGQDGLYLSPRVQGAGLMNLEKVVHDVLVTVVDNDSSRTSYNQSKIEFKVLNSNQLNFNLKLKNYSDRDITYDVYNIIETDAIDNGRNTMTPALLKQKTKIGEVSLAANAEASFNYTDSFDEGSYPALAPKGYFVDGFLFFEPKAARDGAIESPIISIPYFGFKGEWYDMPVIEPFIDQFKLPDKPIFIENIPDEKMGEITEDNSHFTHFWSDIMLDPIAGIAEKYTLGRFPSDKWTDNFAISPNGDGYQDFVGFHGVFLRNYQDLGLRIYDKDNKELNFIQNTWRQEGRKSLDTINNTSRKSQYDAAWTWNGKNIAGNTVPDGKYIISIEARQADNKQAELQEIKREIIVDTIAPTVSGNSSVKFENGKITATIDGVADEASGVKTVYMIDNNDWWFELVPTQDGSWLYDLPAPEKYTHNPDKTIFRVVDWAGNVYDYNPSLAKGEGKVIFNKINNVDENDIPSNEIEVYALNADNSLGAKVDATKLPLGKYVAMVKDAPANYKISFKPNSEFEITEENKEVNIDVEYERIDDNEFGTLVVRVVFPLDYNGLLKIYAVDKDGKRYQLDRRLQFQTNEYQVKVPAGEYTIEVEGSNAWVKPNIEGIDKPIIVEAQEETWHNIQAIFAIYGIKTFIGNGNTSWKNYIDQKDIVGNDQDGYQLSNPEKYFKIVNTNTGTSLFESQADDPYKNLANAYITWMEDTIIELQIGAPTGEYAITFIGYDKTKYALEPAVVYNNTTAWDADAGVGWKGTHVYAIPAERGSIKINEIFYGNSDNKDTLDAIYTLYDATGEEVMSYHDKEYIDLPQGAYTLKVRSRSQNWNPEKTEYKIWLNAGEAKVQDVRWQDLSKNKKNYTGINVSFYGLTHELKAKSIDAIKLSFTREGTTDVTDHTVPIGEGEGKSEIYLPIGAYTVKILNLPEEYKAVLRYTDNGDVRERYPDGRSLKAIFTTSYSDLEFDIVKEKVEIKGQSTLTIEEVGNKGFFVNYTLKGENYIETKSTNRFINLVPGEYTLTVDPDSIPRGYRLVSGAGKITIADGENNVRVVFEVELDKTELKALVSEADKVKASDDYNKSLDQAKEAYDSAVEEAKAVLNKADATQKDIDKAAIKIKAAKQNLAPVDEIVPQTGEEKPEVPSDYVEVKFVAGAHGKLEGTTIFWVNPRVEVELKAPTAIPDDGYTFSKWDKDLKAKFIEATTITALYEKTVEIIVPEAPIDNGYRYEPSPDYLKDIRRTERPQPKEEAKKDEPKEEQPATPVAPQPKTYGLEIAEAATPLVFDDINSHILKGDIDFVTARGIMKGTDNGKFEPDTPISRAMVVETLMRISEDKSITSPATFNDVKENDWYYNSVSWAAANNIVLGDDNNNFKPNELVSKQELALILQRFLKLRGITLDKITEYAYSDEIPEWSKDAVKAMVEVGLITGETTLNPTGEVTRAELARALRIIIEWVEANR